MGIYITIDCTLCGQQHRLGHCVHERRERQREAWHARAAAAGHAGVTQCHAGVTQCDMPMTTPPAVALGRCPACRELPTRCHCRRGSTLVGSVAVAPIQPIQADPPAKLPFSQAMVTGAALAGDQAVDAAAVGPLPADVVALALEHAGRAGLAPAEWLGRAARAYARVPASAAERKRASRARSRRGSATPGVCCVCGADAWSPRAWLCIGCGDRGGESARRAVAAEVAAGKLTSADTLQCADCGGNASIYDHRDYGSPLGVQAVCGRCNVLRGPADLPVPTKAVTSEAPE